MIALELCPACLLNADRQSISELVNVETDSTVSPNHVIPQPSCSIVRASMLASCRLYVLDSLSGFVLSFIAGNIHVSGLPSTVPSTSA